MQSTMADIQIHLLYLCMYINISYTKIPIETESHPEICLFIKFFKISLNIHLA